MLRIFITYLLSLPLFSGEEIFYYNKIIIESEQYYCIENPTICEKIKENPYNLNHLEFLPERRPATKAMWVTFSTLQLLDIYSTDRGMRFDCVKELNPLLPQRPTVTEMALLKFSVLYPTYRTINDAITITDRDLLGPILITGAVVVNNYNVNRRASKYCRKIR